jgi:hypothetical protein
MFMIGISKAHGKKVHSIMSILVFVCLEKNGKLIAYGIFESVPSERPGRETTANPPNYSWKGYLQGNYMMSEFVGS